MQTISVKELFKDHTAYEEVKLMGWIRSNRDNGSIGFISFTDGSSIHSLQLVYKEKETQNFDVAKTASTGSAILVEGKVLTSARENQKFEVLVLNFTLLKKSESDFPLQKKEHSNEFLRSIAHLRHRTNKYGAVMRLRSEIVFAIHNFFHQNNFVNITPPILTTNDCEGGGENFFVDSKSLRNFFGKQAYLTVSNQLHAEAYAQGYKRVYTFAPTFRAEKSNTNRHLAEFWMVEPEIAFCNLTQLMYLIEEFFKYLIRFVLKNCKEEMNFLNKLNNYELEAKLLNVLENDFEKIPYKKAITILKNDLNQNKVKFEYNNIYFGMDLKSEHERYISEVVFQKPVFVYNYPQEIKPFYAKLNQDGTTVGCCDLLIPGVGELIGGSEREDDYSRLVKKCHKLNMSTKEINWYLELRKFGYFKSSGFGLGLERLIMYLTNTENIKDTIPFPRTYGNIDF